MNVKPGDMARFVAPGDPGHGTILEVICATPTREYPPDHSDEFMWDIKVFNGVTTCNWRGGISFESYALPGTVCMAADRYLRRIEPNADDTAEQASEVNHAPCEALPA